jgi:GNAT superfamily N-acetyltransferase
MLETRDLPEVAELLRAFMRETFDKPWNGSERALARDAFGKELYMAVAGEPPLGFIGWTRAYDLHHCISGASICDMYVAPKHRGRGVAIELVCFAAAQIKNDGGIFIQGQAVPGREEEYSRIAMSFPGASCIIGGRAFRTLADLAGKTPREIARMLPKREWNFEP